MAVASWKHGTWETHIGSVAVVIYYCHSEPLVFPAHESQIPFSLKDLFLLAAPAKAVAALIELKIQL